MQELSGWGLVPRVRCAVFRPERRSAIRSILATGARSSYIARGLGRSCGDAALNADAGVIDMARLNRFLGFNAETGELDCEAGVSLGEILDIFLPRGFTLGATPGTRYVTVGGAIAADVHGRNHHKAGTFSQYVNAFTLLTATGENLQCSETSESDAFWSTIGGMGLTGVILTVRLRLLPVETSYLKLDCKRTANLDETLAALKAGEERVPYVEAKLDTSASGVEMGRARVLSGRHALLADLPEYLHSRPLAVPPPSERVWPEFLAGLLPQGLDILYRAGTEGRLTDYRSFFHPWDATRNWNRVHGRKGLTQYQAVFPAETSSAGVRELLGRVNASGHRPLHALLKGCGAENSAPMSFPMPGHMLTFTFPNSDGMAALLGELDLLVLKHRGRIFLARDAALNSASLERMYPRLETFRTVVRRLDPRGLFSSNQARRLGLKTSALRTAIGGGTT